MSVTIADYAWWGTWRPDWAEAHCVTLVSDATPELLLAAVGATPVAEVYGVDALIERSMEHHRDGYAPDWMIGAAAVADGWTMVAEDNGWMGVESRVMGPVSAGRTVVSHFRNVNAVYQFNWWRDGQLLVDFDLLFPADRFGTEPDALVDDILGVGLPLDAKPDEIATIDFSAAGFALAQRITGVACTPEMFERSNFVVATVPIPSG